MSLWGHVSARPNWFQEVKSCIVNGLIAREIVYWMEGLIWFVVILALASNNMHNLLSSGQVMPKKGILHFFYPQYFDMFSDLVTVQGINLLTR